MPDLFMRARKLLRRGGFAQIFGVYSKNITGGDMLINFMCNYLKQHLTGSVE